MNFIRFYDLHLKTLSTKGKTWAGVIFLDTALTAP